MTTSYQRALARADEETERKRTETPRRPPAYERWNNATTSAVTRATPSDVSRKVSPAPAAPPPPIPTITPLDTPPARPPLPQPDNRIMKHTPPPNPPLDPTADAQKLTFDEWCSARGYDPAVSKPKGNAAYTADRQQGTTKRGAKPKATAAKKPARKPAAKTSGRRPPAQPRQRAVDPDEQLDADPDEVAEIRQYVADFSAPTPVKYSAADLAEHDPVYVMLPSRAIPIGGLRWERALDDRLMPQVEQAIAQLVEIVAFDQPDTSAAEQWAIRVLIQRLGQRLTSSAPILLIGGMNQ